MPFRGERARVSTTDSSINAGNHFIPRKRWNQPVFSAPTSDDPWHPAAIFGGFVPVPRGTNCKSSVVFEEPTQPPQDPQFPFLLLRRNAQTRFSRIAAAIVRMKIVVNDCQSILESSGESRLPASQLWPTGAISPKIAYNWLGEYFLVDILQPHAFSDLGDRSLYDLLARVSSLSVAVAAGEKFCRRTALSSKNRGD